MAARPRPFSPRDGYLAPPQPSTAAEIALISTAPCLIIRSPRRTASADGDMGETAEKKNEEKKPDPDTMSALDGLDDKTWCSRMKLDLHFARVRRRPPRPSPPTRLALPVKFPPGNTTASSKPAPNHYRAISNDVDPAPEITTAKPLFLPPSLLQIWMVCIQRSRLATLGVRNRASRRAAKDVRLGSPNWRLIASVAPPDLTQPQHHLGLIGINCPRSSLDPEGVFGLLTIASLAKLNFSQEHGPWPLLCSGVQGRNVAPLSDAGLDFAALRIVNTSGEMQMHKRLGPGPLHGSSIRRIFALQSLRTATVGSKQMVCALHGSRRLSACPTWKPAPFS
jgi:hypothetical protein